MTSTIEAPQTHDAQDFDSNDSTPFLWIVLATIPVAVGALLQRFGEIVSLTRLDRILDPFTMAARGFDLWNPYWDTGAVQFQQNGYWLPFDLWFGTAKLLHIPPWISERLFIYAFISIALWGFVRLADAFSIGRPWTRLAAGFAYATAPVILTRIGWQSPFAMGIVFLPWAILPLVRATQSGSTRRAAAQSAIAIALMGGANAAVTLAILPIPLLYALTRSRGPRRASLLRWWILTVPLAMLWWGVGLYLFGKYGPNVLGYTETVQTTTGPTSIFEVLRGTADWVSRLPGGTNPAGFSLSLRSVPIIGTSIVAAAGIAGLARRKLPERTFLLACLLVGVAVVGGGYGGPFSNPATSLYRTLLDEPFNAFRNVYKFQPWIVLPLAFGFAHFLVGISDLDLVKARTWAKRVLAFATIAVLALASWPLWRNLLTRGPGATQIPQAWIDANDWLANNSPGRALVLPGIPDSDFEWGFTAQVPIQWGSNVTWATRSQAPLSGLDIVEYLDATELSIERGGNSRLPDYLARGGFTAVVVPNDQRSEIYGAPPPETVRNALIASGFQLTKSFGDTGYGFGSLQQVDIYAIPGGAVATTYASSAATWLSGGIGSALAVPTSVFGKRPYLLTRELSTPALQPKQWIITDGNQALTIDYGLNRNNESYIHGAADDEVPLGQDPNSRTVQELDGFSSVTASSVGPGIILSDIPAFGPANVLDGETSTWWVPHRDQVNGAEAWGTVDPYVDVEFNTPTSLDQLEMALYIGPFATLGPVDVTTRTDAGEATTTLLPIQAKQSVNVVPGVTTSIRVSIARHSFASLDEAIGIRELVLPGTPVSPRLVLPSQLESQFSQPGTPDPAWVFTRNLPAWSPVVSLNGERQLSRAFTVPKSGTFRMATSASATRDQKLLQWLGTTPNFSITADSTWGENPNVGPRNLVDGDSTSPWRSGNDITVTGGSSLIAMKWTGQRTLSSLRLVRGSGDAQPTDVVIYAGSEARGAPVAPDGTLNFEPLTTDSITLRINYAPIPLDDQASSKQMGFTSIDVPAVADLYPGPLHRDTPYAATCGTGPSVVVGSTTISYSVNTTTGTLLDGTSIDLVPCGTDSATLNQGRTLLDATSGTSLVTINQIVLGNSPTMAPPSGTARELSIDHWGTNDRTVTVASGSEGLLVINEAFNPGWKATLNGASLSSFKVDGWRQAFVLPEGEGGTVHLQFAPDRLFKAGTIFGLFTLVGVFMMALWPDRKKRKFDALNIGQPAPALLIAATVLGAVWCTGIAAVVLLPLWWLRNHRRTWLAPLAFFAMAGAGLLTVYGKRLVDYPSHLWGATSYPVLALSAVAFLCALITLLPRRTPLSAEPTDDVAAPATEDLSA